MCFTDVCSEQSKWITEALQSPPHTLLDLIVTANSPHVRNDDQDLVSTTNKQTNINKNYVLLKTNFNEWDSSNLGYKKGVRE